MAASSLLLYRMADFLRHRKEAIVCDSAGFGKNESQFPWDRRLGPLVQETADRLLARAAADAPSEPAPVAGDGIQALLLESSHVRSCLLRALNRFQVEQGTQHDFTAMEMTEARQETMHEFESLLTAHLSRWIGREKARTSALDPHALAEVHEGLKGVLGLLRLAIETVPPSSRLHIAAAANQLSRFTTRLQEATSLDAAPPPAAEAAPPPPKAEAAPLPPPLPREPLRLTPLHVASFVRTLTDAFRPEAERKGLRFESRCGPVPEIIQTDAARLHRAASLLLNHSVTHTRTGGIVLTAGLHATGRWLLGIRDTGPEVPPELLSRLLLGLSHGGEEPPAEVMSIALARDLTDLLGGTLEADWTKGEGTFFRILLPLHAGAKGENG